MGRLAQFIATRLRGKHRVDFTPNVDNGDSVVVINAKEVELTAKKGEQKLYIRHSGYPGGLKVATAREVRAKRSSLLLEEAVSGMMPRSKLARKQLTNLFIYDGPEHKQQAQSPEPIEVNFKIK